LKPYLPGKLCLAKKPLRRQLELNEILGVSTESNSTDVPVEGGIDTGKCTREGHDEKEGGHQEPWKEGFAKDCPCQCLDIGFSSSQTLRKKYPLFRPAFVVFSHSSPR
jgi:hypothetical protein